jgi:hypothetical protein
MSTKARTDVAKLRQRYSRQFKVPLEDILEEERPVRGPDGTWRGDWVVYAKNRDDLPQWTIGYDD